MMFILSSILKTAVVLLVGLVSAAALRRRSAALRHGVLCVALFVVTILPLLSWLMPEWPVIRLGSLSQWPILNEGLQPGVATGVRQSDEIPVAHPLSAGQLFAIVWVTGFVISVSRLLFAMIHLRRIASASATLTSGRWSEMAATLSGN